MIFSKEWDIAIDHDELGMTFDEEDYGQVEKINLIQRIKRDFAEHLQAYNKQIRKDMDFWIKYRPSRWGNFIPDRVGEPILKFIERKEGRKFLLKTALIASLIFVGVMPTLNFIWSNIFRVWLILLIVPLAYWSLAIAAVYSRVIALAVCEFAIVVLDNLIN